MSNNRQTQPTLPSYDGRLSSPSIDGFRNPPHRVGGPNTIWLLEAAKDTEGYANWLTGLITSDGYRWLWSFEFVKDSGRLVVLFSSSKDRTESDIDIAVYTQGVDEVAADQVVQAFAQAYKQRVPRTARRY